MVKVLLSITLGYEKNMQEASHYQQVLKIDNSAET